MEVSLHYLLTQKANPIGAHIKSCKTIVKNTYQSKNTLKSKDFFLNNPSCRGKRIILLSLHPLVEDNLLFDTQDSPILA